MSGVNLLLVENIFRRRVVIIPRCVIISPFIEYGLLVPQVHATSKEAFFDKIDDNEKKGGNLK